MAIGSAAADPILPCAMETGNTIHATIMSMFSVVLITGISGSGKSVALRLLEDSGYTCVDNLPVRFLSDFIASARDDAMARVAVAIDVRSPGNWPSCPLPSRRCAPWAHVYGWFSWMPIPTRWCSAIPNRAAGIR